MINLLESLEYNSLSPLYSTDTRGPKAPLQNSVPRRNVLSSIDVTNAERGDSFSTTTQPARSVELAMLKCYLYPCTGPRCSFGLIGVNWETKAGGGATRRQFRGLPAEPLSSIAFYSAQLAVIQRRRRRVIK